MVLPEGIVLPKNHDDTKGLLQRYYALCLTFAVGTIVSIVCFVAVLGDQTRDIEVEFGSGARDHFNLIHSHMQDYQERLLILADMLAYNNRLGDQPVDLAKALPSSADFLTLQWWPEGELLTMGVPSMPIPEAVRRILNSRILKQPVMSAPFSYNHATDVRQAVALVVPVVRSGDLLGHVVGVVDIAEIAAGIDDIFYAFDVTAPDAPVLLHPSTLAHNGGLDNVVDIDSLYKYVPYHAENQGQFWGRHWRMLITPAIDRTAATISTGPWLVLGGGMTLTLAVALFLYSIIGKNARLQAVNEDIKAKEELLVLYTKHTPIAVAMLDKKMRYIAYSDRWVTDYGLQYEGDLIGRYHYELFPEIPEKYPQWVEEHKACLAGEVISMAKESFIRADGRTEWLRYELRPWRRDSKVAGMIMFTEIITDRVEAEQMIVQQGEELGRGRQSEPS